MVNPIQKVVVFLEETSAELKRSSWPTRKELRDSTVVVMVTMVLFGIFVATADFVFVRMVKIVTGSM